MAATAQGEQTSPGAEQDRAALEQLERQQADAWGRGDGVGFATTFTDDADFVAVTGEHLLGRAAIAASVQEGLDTFMQGTRWAPATQRHVRFVSPDVAIMVTSGVCVLRPGEEACRPGTESIQTRVAVKRDGTWKFTSFQNTRIGPPAA